LVLLLLCCTAYCRLDVTKINEDCPTRLFANGDVLLNQVFNIPNPYPGHPFDFIAVNPCGTLDDGCNPPGGGNMCTGPGCCSICMNWNVGIANPGSACLGKFVGFDILPNSTIRFHYLGGDPVPPPGPPDPGYREAVFSVDPGTSMNFSNIAFVDANGRKAPDGNYVYGIFAGGPTAPCGQEGISTNCNKCLNPSLNSTCVWCLDTKSCTTTMAPCRNFFTNRKFCPAPCSSLSSCNACTKQNCVWCDYPTPMCNDDPAANCQYEVQDPQYCPAPKKGLF